MNGLYLDFYDLSLTKQAKVIGDIYRLFKTNNDINVSILEVFVSHNLMCPHFIYHRKYGGFVDSLNIFKWFECDLCESAVISPTNKINADRDMVFEKIYKRQSC